jgi:hypothetical protein
MDRALEREVWNRALDRCEYCGISQRYETTPFHINHIIARKHRGQTALPNLALACYNCNLHKGPNIGGVDPETGRLTPRFNPRTDLWRNHFCWQGTSLMGLTDVGRTTVQVLAINRSDRAAHRKALGSEGFFPW